MKNIALYFGPNIREDNMAYSKTIKDFYRKIMNIGVPRASEMIMGGHDCDQVLLGIPDEYVQKVIEIANETKGLCAKINLTD